MVGCGAGTEVPDCEDGQADEVCEVFRMVNRARSDQGLDAYAWNTELAVAAQRHAEDMSDNDYFDHASQDGRSFADRAQEAGYGGGPRGENIALGQQSPEQVMESWMNSEGHRRNILEPGSNEIGVGLENAYWVQGFGVRSDTDD